MTINSLPFILFVATFLQQHAIATAYIDEIAGRFVAIKQGDYVVGSLDEKSRQPRRTVTLSEFEIGETVITQRAFFEIMGENPSRFQYRSARPVDNMTNDELTRFGRREHMTAFDQQEFFRKVNNHILDCFDIPAKDSTANHPVENVCWNDAVTFAERLSEKDINYNYFLPTPNQLEVALRGGASTLYVTGDDLAKADDYVFHMENALRKTYPVNAKKPNNFGVYASSVSQWTSEVFSEYSTSHERHEIPFLRAVCGSSFWTRSEDCQLDYRGMMNECSKCCSVGFRLVRVKK